MTMTAPNEERRALERNYQFMRSLIKGSSLEWVVVRTNPNCEDRAFEGINAVGLTAYLPMMAECRRSKTRKKQFAVSCLMFPRYLFVGLDVNAGHTCDLVRKCDGVEKILSATLEGAPHRVPMREMLRIVDTACEAEVGRKLVKGQLFSIGDKVMLVAGVGAQLIGEVRSFRQGGELVRVELEAFGRVMNATVPVDKVSLG
ncbi:transcription termination/antitermination NusG family protein [Pseudovibrio sp. Ad26]|uniref:transcription termination/antitermination NusG family protein n=1 Tax=Pseudovibrio sp. Ad26 TaxID=989410 RepID=UPI0007AE7336|nr:transcription termination/antitermination NusG family protein [Pseudovibrio sp. Ad26]KZL06384.1 Transcription antitermination protein RfaH [Pseudovibrio sp. Ad26]